MTLISVSTIDKTYDGRSYIEYTFRAKDGYLKRLYKCTGRTPCTVLTSAGEVIEDSRLDRVDLSDTSDISSIEFYFDQRDRVNGIELVISEKGGSSDEELKKGYVYY